jgi:hypothetical protein
MKTLKKTGLIMSLTGFILMSAVFAQGQFSTLKSGHNYSDQIDPYVSAGKDAISCNNGPFITQGFIQGSNGLTIWKTNGDGAFNNVYNLESIYTPGTSDRKAGVVTLTLTYIYGGFEGGEMIHDDMILYFIPCLGSGETEINEM